MTGEDERMSSWKGGELNILNYFAMVVAWLVLELGVAGRPDVINKFNSDPFLEITCSSGDPRSFLHP